jgi:hypothetical protein
MLRRTTRSRLRTRLNIMGYCRSIFLIATSPSFQFPTSRKGRFLFYSSIKRFKAEKASEFKTVMHLPIRTHGKAGFFQAAGTVLVRLKLRHRHVVLKFFGVMRLSQITGQPTSICSFVDTALSPRNGYLKCATGHAEASDLTVRGSTRSKSFATSEIVS